MDERQARIHEDLRGLLEGELLFDPLDRSAYAIDAGPGEIEPLGVVVPRHEEDVVHLVRYAAENAISLHPRGAGTSRAGATLGSGLVVDFSCFFRQVIDIQSDRVVVQPGVVLDELNQQLAPFGRRIGPDPNGATRTIGGMVALDASGPCALRYGTTRDHIERLRVVFANGDVADIGQEAWPGFDDEPEDFKGLVVRKLGGLVRRNLDLLVRKSPHAPRGRVGYALAQAASGVGIHLPRLLAGSEGTLALTTELTLRTVPIAPAQSALLLPFSRIADAAATAAGLLDTSPTACELFDWRTIHLAREQGAQYREWIAEAAESVLVVLFEGEATEEVAGRAQRLTERVARGGGLVADPVVVTRRADCERMLAIRRLVEPLMMRMRGRARPFPVLDALAVAPDRLPELLQRVQNVMRSADVTWTASAHAGLGELHVRPFLDPTQPNDLDKIEPLACELFAAVIDLEGTVVGSEGCGLMRAMYLRRQMADLIPVFSEVKVAFDPLNLLNPGRVIGDDSHLESRSPRQYPVLDLPSVEQSGEIDSISGETLAMSSTEINIVPGFLPVLRWGESIPEETASACNGCGACRTLDAGQRMCPMFRAIRAERATPRAKANLIRRLFTGQIDPRLWGSDELKRHADLCVHCKLCEDDCPSGVDVSSLMLEAKAAYVENHGMTPGEWAFSRIELWSRIASRVPLISNAVLGSRKARWLLERLIGLSRLRRLPKVQRTPFTRRVMRLGLHRPRPHEPGPRVAYFVDIAANYYDHELAEAVVAVLRHAGVNVYIPIAQRDSGMPSLVAGDVEHARELALANLRLLGNAVRDGYTVVCSEPTSALMLRQEYLKLTDDLDAALVAENTREIGQYLAGLNARGQLPPSTTPLRLKVGYHQPCHHRTLHIGTPGLDLMRRIPEIDVEFIDRGCSGMAGTFGLRAEHFRTSLRAGRGLLNRLRDPDLNLGATECSTCRMQMELFSDRLTLHPVKLLSLSYGLSPALHRTLHEVGMD